MLCGAAFLYLIIPIFYAFYIYSIKSVEDSISTANLASLISFSHLGGAQILVAKLLSTT